MLDINQKLEFNYLNAIILQRLGRGAALNDNHENENVNQFSYDQVINI